MAPISQTTDLLGLVVIAMLLGMRHGFDADHLAAIDAMTRFNAIERPSLARRTGVWFSLGHGGVVMAIALGVNTISAHWTAPPWLEPFGAWASIAMLVVLGVMNLLAMRADPAGLRSGPTGWRSRLFGRVMSASGRTSIMGVGALFAMSFDTISQATLIAAGGAAVRGVAGGCLLAAVFVLGMIATDGLNGWWVARLIARSGHGARRASVIMCWAVAGVSLGTAALGAATQASPAVAAWARLHELQFGGVIVAIVLVSFLLGHALAPVHRRSLERASETIA